MATQAEIDSIVDPLIAAGVTGEQLVDVLQKATASLAVTLLTAQLRTYDEQTQEYVDYRTSERATIEAQLQAAIDALGALSVGGA